METEVQKAGRGAHDGKTCPGWYLARDGGIEGCLDCGFSDEDDIVYEKADEFFSKHASRHAAHDECDGCPGLEVREPIGSVSNRTRFWIERSDICGVFKNDLMAISAAVEMCLSAGFIVVDGS